MTLGSLTWWPSHTNGEEVNFTPIGYFLVGKIAKNGPCWGFTVPLRPLVVVAKSLRDLHQVPKMTVQAKKKKPYFDPRITQYLLIIKSKTYGFDQNLKQSTRSTWHLANPKNNMVVQTTYAIFRIPVFLCHYHCYCSWFCRRTDATFVKAISELITIDVNWKLEMQQNSFFQIRCLLILQNSN